MADYKLKPEDPVRFDYPDGYNAVLNSLDLYDEATNKEALDAFILSVIWL